MAKKDLTLTFIDLGIHFVSSTVLAWVFYVKTGGWLWPALAFTGGVLIDADHLMDYFRYFGRKFDLLDFLKSAHLASGRCRVIFHSWELAAVLWVLSVWIKWLLPLASGMTIHLTVDLLLNHRKEPLFLFLIHRWRNGFEVRKILPGSGRF